ncbi:MAG: SpoIIE family protein phosphatase [Planctomycetaceae bacterium]|jgi:phosphoserine phosphatase RsbU/P|nr:SpoIIE family protein phosphatase [Planctomycetaceae bacterium]MDG2389617.1 SpoIIE family protein phosphatase [Planctomycetaceae bacterium]
MAYLKVIAGSAPGQIIELTEDQTVVGRHPDSQIVLDNAAVSRHHAKIHVSHGRYYLEDLRSRNGTFINDKQVLQRSELKEHDQIDICEIILEFTIDLPEKFLGEEFELGPSDSEDPASSTRVGQEIPALTEAEGGLESSSILSSINAAESSQSISYRLDINSEAKLKAVLEISQALNRVLDVDEALQRTMKCLFQIFPQADEGFAMLIDPVSRLPVVRSILSRTKNQDGRVSRTVLDYALSQKTAVLTEDAQSDQRFSSSESIAGAKLRSLVCIPLLDQNQESLGVIQLAAYSLIRSFTSDDLDLLTSVAGQVSLAIENAAMHQQLISQRDLQRDLEYAHQIQLGFLPSNRPETTGYDFSDYYESAQSVGGDYFDYILLPRQRWAFTIADVAGKGIPAALLMARLYSAARYHLLTTDNMARAIEGLNNELATGGVGHRFVTCVLAVLNPETHKVKLANAGHLPPIMRRADGTVNALSRKDSGLPLGLEPSYTYKQIELTLQPGDTILLYTDGTTEACDSEQELFGMDRLMQSVATAPAESDELIRHVLNDIEKFAGGDSNRDDVCLVALHRHPE